MISLKSPREIEAMEKSGAVLAGMHICHHSTLQPCRCNPSVRSCSRRKPGRGRSQPSTFPSLLST